MVRSVYCPHSLLVQLHCLPIHTLQAKGLCRDNPEIILTLILLPSLGATRLQCFEAIGMDLYFSINLLSLGMIFILCIFEALSTK